MAATAIGASHLVLSPTAGAAYGYALLWLVPFSHLFKYPAFDFGPRFAVATDRSLLDGYARVPGPRGWALWVFLVGTVVQDFSVLAGVLSVSAVVIHFAVPIVPIPVWSSILGVLAAGLLWSGRFDGLSAFSKGMLTVLAVMTAIAFFHSPPPLAAAIDLIRPRIPTGSMVLAVAILGWMPTGLDVSVWHSMWALERRSDWIVKAGPDGDRRRVFRIARIDLGVGYGLSLVLAVMFVCLGVVVLRPTGAVPSGAEVAVTIARLYTDVLGDWALYPFLTAAFFGMFSSTLGVMDGFPRAFIATARRLWPRSVGSSSRWSWTFLWVCLVLALIEIALLRDPVVLVTVAAVASFLLAPMTYGLNYYCVTRLVDEPTLRPGAWLRAWALLGTMCMSAATALFFYVHFLRG
jgi:Mn2+/Fe2+ NRAMP family transporter